MRMRTRAAALMLLPLAGCNQIFGLDAVDLAPPEDAMPLDGPFPTAHLLMMTPKQSSPTEYAGASQLGPISPAPAVQVGEIGGELVDVAYGANGDITLPYGFETRATQWRLVYTRPGSVPHEVQWNPETGMGYFVEFQTTPDTRPTLPGTPQIVLAPRRPGDATMPYAGGFTAPRVYTTGAWSETRNPVASASQVSFPYALPTTTGIVGPLRSVLGTDRLILADYATQVYDVGGAQFECKRTTHAVPFAIDVEGGARTDTTPQYNQGTAREHTITLEMGAVQQAYLMAAHRETVPSNTGMQLSQFLSVGPAGGVPLLGMNIPNDQQLPRPIGIPLVECNMFRGNLGTHRVPSEPVLMSISSTQYWFPRRMASGPEVSNGVTAVSAQTAGSTTSTNSFNVGIPSDVTLDGKDMLLPTFFPIDLTLQPTSLGGTDPLVTLAFTLQPPDAPVDFYTATLIEVGGGSLGATVRKFTFKSAPMRFDRSLLEAGKAYTLEIRGHRGAPNAQEGDFRDWVNQQNMSRVYTQSFRR